MASLAPSPDSAELSPSRRPLQRSDASWTDDLPLCDQSDVGIAPNTTYGELMPETYVYENRVFNFATDNQCFLYGVFNGHGGSRAAHFASERLPAELLLGQLTPGADDETVKSILAQAFSVVERGFFESIDVELAKKTHLQSQLPEPADLAEKLYPSVVQQIEALNDAIKGGTTALVALIMDDKLYVANVGDSRALLCQYDSQNHLKVRQLNDDHDIGNENEVRRLEKLGLSVDKMKLAQAGKYEFTRCIGDYTIKGGYKDHELLKDATSEPVIACPDVYGGIPLKDVKDGFLILMSDAVYKSYAQATGSGGGNSDEGANEAIAHVVRNQLHYSNRMRGVAQSVADKIAFYHADTFGKQHDRGSREDMTLIVRNINYPVGASALPSLITDEAMSSRHPVSIPYEEDATTAAASSVPGVPAPSFDPHNASPPPPPLSGASKASLSLVMPSKQAKPQKRTSSSSSSYNAHRASSSSPPSDDTPTNLTNRNHLATLIPSSQQHPHEVSPPPASAAIVDSFFRIDRQPPLEVDEENRVAAYVSFACFDEAAWEAASKSKANQQQSSPSSPLPPPQQQQPLIIP